MPATQWTGFRSVLCPIDFSDVSATALRCAAAIARRGRATLTVAYVNDPLLIAATAAALHDGRLAKTSAQELQAFVDATLAPAAKALRLKRVVSTGRPGDEIIKAAARARSDLIVLGTQGLSGADRLLLGSTTLSVLQQATVPVLAVPRDGRPLADPSRWPGERIVAALDLEKGCDKDVDTAAAIARWFDASLLLVHVITRIAAPSWIRTDLRAHDRIRVARAQEQLDALAARARMRVATGARVVCGRVADEVAALAAAERAGLVVTVLRDRRGWFGASRGSISYHVLSHAVTPVLALPSRWRCR